MNSVVEDVANMLLANSSFPYSFNDGLYLYREPAEPANTVTLYETSSMPPVGTLDANTDTKPLERPSLQVRVRNVDPQECFRIAYLVQQILHGLANETWGDYYYAVILGMGGPNMLDWDSNGRMRVVVNFMIQRRLI